MIQFVIVLMLDHGWTKTSACMTVARCGRSYSRVLQLVNHWFKTADVLHSNAPRGQASPKYSRRPIELTAVHQAAINAEIGRLHEMGKCVTARLIQKFLQAEPHNIVVSNRRLYGYLRSWGVVYGRAMEVFKVDPEWHRWRIARYILEYGVRMRLTARGTHVFVYSDESYIHDNHALTMSWFCPGSSRGVTRSKRSARFIIFHAITEYGLLASEPVGIDDDLTVIRANAEYIYKFVPPKGDSQADVESTPATRKDKVDDKDEYHHNVNSDMYLQWLKHRCIPAFKAQFPGKKMILIIDNASYHDAHVDSWKAVHKMNKKELIAAFDQFQIDEFEAFVDGVVLDSTVPGVILPLNPLGTFISYERKNFAKRASADRPEVPTTKQLKKALGQTLRRRPELRPTQVQQLLEAEGFSILFTPPMEPRCQPIENLWGTVKQVVAEQYSVSRTAQQAREQLVDAFYTYRYRHNDADEKGVSPRQCAAMVQRAREWMAEFVKDNPDYLSGPLDNLMWESGLYQRPADKEELSLLRDRRIIDREWNLESAEDYNTSELLALNCLGNQMDLTSVDRINLTDAMDDDDDSSDFRAQSEPPGRPMEPQLLLESSMYPLRMHPGFLSTGDSTSSRTLNF